jgi:hypothetical protein
LTIIPDSAVSQAVLVPVFPAASRPANLFLKAAELEETALPQP